MTLKIFKRVFFLMLVTAVMLCATAPAYAAGPFVVNGTTYNTFNEAVQNVSTNGIIEVYSDFVLDRNVELPAGSYIKVCNNISIYLNNFTLSGVDNASGSACLISNSTDSPGGYSLTVNGPGTLSYSALNNRGWSASSAVISNRNSYLTVSNGPNIIHNGGTDMAYAIDNITYMLTSSVTVNSGNITSTNYRAIRQFANNWIGSGENILTINGGSITGGRSGIYLQDSSDVANKARLTVTSGNIDKIYVEINTKVDANISVPANTVGAVETSNNPPIPKGVILANVNGTYGYYNTVQEAFNAAGPNGSIGLTHAVDLTSDVSVPNGVTVNLNGNNVSSTNGSKLVVKEGERMDVTGSGSANVNGQAVTGGNRVAVTANGTTVAPIPTNPTAGAIGGVGAPAADPNPYGVPSTGSERDTALMISLAVLSGSVLLFSLRRKKEA